MGKRQEIRNGDIYQNETDEAYLSVERDELNCMGVKDLCPGKLFTDMPK